MPSRHEEIRPNYLTAASRDSERGLEELIQKAKILGASSSEDTLSKESILTAVEALCPERVTLVSFKLSEEGLSLEDLQSRELLDRLLGVDAVVSYRGKRFGIDVTTGKGTVLANKKAKASELKGSYRTLGFAGIVIVRLRTAVTDEVVADLCCHLDDLVDGRVGDFVTVLKYTDNES